MKIALICLSFLLWLAESVALQPIRTGIEAYRRGRCDDPFAPWISRREFFDHRADRVPLKGNWVEFRLNETGQARIILRHLIGCITGCQRSAA
jgi:hypothetical protein